MHISDVKGALEKNATIFMYVIMRTCLGDTLPFIHSRSTIIQAYLASHWYGSVVASSTPVFCVQFATNPHRLNILR